MAASVAFVPLYVAVIGVIGVPYFRKVCGFDLATSYYAAMPGGLQDMVVFGQEAGADVRALSLIHATRVLIIVTLVPLMLLQVFDRPLTQPIGEPARDLPWSELGLMVLAAWIGWKGGERIGLFGATILGPMIVTAALSLAGLIEHRPPEEAILFAQFFIGTGIGVCYVGVTLAELRKDVLAGIAYVGILAAVGLPGHGDRRDPRPRRAGRGLPVLRAGRAGRDDGAGDRRGRRPGIRRRAPHPADRDRHHRRPAGRHPPRLAREEAVRDQPPEDEG